MIFIISAFRLSDLVHIYIIYIHSSNTVKWATSKIIKNAINDFVLVVHDYQKLLMKILLRIFSELIAMNFLLCIVLQT